MRDITRLNIELIDDNGRYLDIKRNNCFRLTDQEIIEIRRYHHNRLIAKKRVRPKEASYKVNVYGEKTLKRKAKVYRTKKRRRITKRWLKRNAKALIIRTALGVSLAAGVFGTFKGVNTLIDSKKEHSKVDSSFPELYTDIKEPEVVSFMDEEEQKRNLIIKRYCDIFQIDYDMTYYLLANLTNNFTSDDYYEGRIPGVRCKGVEVQADSEEELLVYAIRNIKQRPEQFGLSEATLCIDNGYTSNTDYFGQIKYYANLFGLDECLIAAIIQSETGFDSQLFNNINNPAGLRSGEDWWEFANKEEGFIELCLEIEKDYRRIDVPKAEVSDKIIAAIGSIHAPESDGNEYWVGNVISNYNKYKNNYGEYFVKEEVKGSKKII